MNDLNELERVKLENFALRIIFMQHQLQQMQEQRASFLRQIEADHPGCEWDETAGRLVVQEAEEEFIPVLNQA